jgi:hypothetical protein
MLDLIKRHQEQVPPIKPELVAVLFFEESIFCNVIQIKGGRMRQ